MKGFFMIRTGDVVNVEAVETTPTIDIREDHPTARALRCKPLRRLQRAGQFRDAGGSGNVGALVRWKVDDVEPNHQLALVKRKIEGMALYGI